MYISWMLFTNQYINIRNFLIKCLISHVCERKKMCAYIYIYIYSICNQIAYLLDAIYYSMHVIYDYLGISQVWWE